MAFQYRSIAMATTSTTEQGGGGGDGVGLVVFSERQIRLQSSVLRLYFGAAVSLLEHYDAPLQEP